MLLYLYLTSTFLTLLFHYVAIKLSSRCLLDTVLYLIHLEKKIHNRNTGNGTREIIVGVYMIRSKLGVRANEAY